MASDRFELTFMGTGDASGFPHPFCNCENCVEARQVKGKSFRLRSHALINDELLIDLSPDLLVSSYLREKPLHDIKYVVQTHPHMDHLEPAHFGMRTARFGIEGLEPIGFWGTDASVQEVRRQLREMGWVRELGDSGAMAAMQLTLHTIAAHETFEVGPYRFTAVPASHDEPGVAVLYGIEYGPHTIFYGTDTGPIVDAAWDTFARLGLTFDVVILDHTHGVKDGTAGHMSGAMVLDARDTMQRRGLLRDGARVIGTHNAPHSNPVHEKMSAIAAESGYEIAYDGMVVTLGDE